MTCSRWVLAMVLALSASTTALQAAPVAPQNVPPRVDESAVPRLEIERQQLFAQMMADPSNLDIAFRYASISSEVGDLEGAIATLERMLIFAPGLPRLQLELGVLYYRLGANDTAQTYFAAALATPDVPDEVRTKVESYLVAINRRDAVDRFSGTLMTGLRWQSNANAAPELREIHTTLLADPLLLDPAALGDSDINGFAIANLHYSHDLGGQGDRLEANLQTYGALYAEQHEINTGFAELTLGPTFNLERFGVSDTALSLYGIVGGVTLEDDPYLLSGGVGANLTTALDARTQLSLRGEYRGESFEDSDLRPTASQRDGDRVRGTFGVQHQLTTRLAVFGAVNAEHREADRDYLSYTELGVTVGGSLFFASPFASQAEPWAVGLSGGYIDRDYDQPDTVFSLTDAESDEEAFVEGSLTVPLQEDWAVQTVLGYRDVDSNYDIRRYDNVSASLGVVKRF